MNRRHLGRTLNRAQRMGVLLELAKLRASELVKIVGNTDDTLALLEWLQEEADEAVAEDQSLLGDQDGFACAYGRIGGFTGEDE
ncbi:hypothetical protein [Desulfocurvibacter africanus]|uniref:hypothetical protein n=1 Tax=Desulfocurvibacter africanus TaxID=873 RepID=UPI0004075859|nr:hypothetical protein [Desulfocurvibacter africanus]